MKKILNSATVRKCGSKIILFFIILFIILCHPVFAEEKDSPTFKLPEEIIFGKGKNKENPGKKEGVQSEEKIKLEELEKEKAISFKLLEERQGKKLLKKEVSDKLFDMDLSAGTYSCYNLNINYSRTFKKINLSVGYDKETGNHTRDHSYYNYNSLTSQLFGRNCNLILNYKNNQYDLPGEIVNVKTDSFRVCNDIDFNLTFKPESRIIKDIYFTFKGEKTDIEDKASLTNQSAGFKVLYNFDWHKSPYLILGDIEENRLKTYYTYKYYSLNLENRSLPITDKSQVNYGIGINKLGDEKIELNPKTKIFYSYNPTVNIEGGVQRQSNIIKFYSLYGRNNFSEINILPLKNIGIWQTYVKASKKLDKNRSFEAKLLHEWVKNMVIYDEDETNPNGLWKPINLNKMQKDSIEFSYNHPFTPDLSAILDCEYIFAWNNNQTEVVPLQSNNAKATLEYNFRDYQFSLENNFIGKRYYDKDRSEKLGGYYLLDFNVEKHISANLYFYLKGLNILDKKYEIIKHYPADRAKFIVGCHIIF